MKTLIRNIGQIAGIVEESVLRKNGEEMSQTGTLDNAWILIDGEGGMVLPTFCDSHTHIVFACTREAIERSL